MRFLWQISWWRAALLLGCVCFVQNVGAQDLQRYLVTPVEPDGGGIQHVDIVTTVQGRNGEIYVAVDRPEIGGNIVGVLLEDGAVQELRLDRPDLRFERDREIVPDSGAGVPWSLDRMDQRLGTDANYFPPVLEVCAENRPFVYVCDTGVLGNHDEFTLAAGRVNLAPSYVSPGLMRTATAWQDPWDHGTGVASCAVGETLGAGRCPVNLVSAVCYPDPGTFPAGSFVSFAADVIYWSLNEHAVRATDGDPFNDASVLVFTSSTTTGPSAILDLAVQRAYLAGMTVVVSAGNQNQDAAMTSPAGANSWMGDITLTVGASTVVDQRWVNSNFGARVELYAPGEAVLAASGTGFSVCMPRNGTSFSAGLVAGAAARILTQNPWASPASVAGVLTDLMDPVYGPSGPFGVGAMAVPKLAFVHRSAVPCIVLPFDDWMDFYGVAGVLPEDDADCDGLANAVEYFMALDPAKWSEKSEWPSLIVNDGGGRYRFRMADYLCEKTTFEVQYTTDLRDWTAVDGASIVEDREVCIEGGKWMVAPIPFGGERVYVRLVVTVP